jgi:large subunit GTPase 1
VDQQGADSNTADEAESSSDSEGPHTPDGPNEENDVSPDSDIEENSDDEKYKFVPTEEDTPDGRDPRTKVLTVLELEDLFISAAPDLSSKECSPSALDCYLIGSFQVLRALWAKHRQNS